MGVSILLNLVIGLATICYVRWKSKSRIPLPPGPKGYPIIGNLFDWSTKDLWVKAHNWCQEYGSDVIYLNVLGQGIVILDSSEAIMNLLERRSSIYSDRPKVPMIRDLMGFSFSLPMAPYGNQWRSQRKLMHHVFHPAAAKNFRPHILKATRNLLRRFIERPGNVLGHVRHMTGDIIVAISYGLDVQPDNDPYIDTSDQAIHMITKTLGSNLVDVLPILKHVPEWMPGAGFQTRAREAKRVAHRLLENPFKVAKDHIDSGNYVPSFVSYCYSLLDQRSGSGPDLEEYTIKWTAGSMYLAGSDTTSSTIIYCIACLLNRPDILIRAQEEIDSVVPLGDLPTFEDEDKLPLITALCMETMRWKELLPFSLPHALSEDDIYKGYRLPKGSIVMGNAWTLLHDENIYPDPFSFKPDRFLKNGKINKEVRDPAVATFGFGRRICPARFMAFPTVWMAVASIIAAFDIAKSPDADGKVIDVDLADDDCEGVLRFPKPFTCSMKPRSAKHEGAILAMSGGEY